MLKKMLSLTVAAIVSIGICIPVQAQSDYKLKALLRIGMPMNLITSLSSKQEDIIYDSVRNRKAEFSGTKTEVTDFHGNGNDIVSKGSISTSTLQLTTAFINFYNSQNYVEEVLVVSQYTWLRMPNVKNIDIISLNWDGSLFYMTDKNGKMNFRTLSSYTEKSALSPSKDRLVDIEQLSRPNEANQSSVGWEYILPSSPIEHVVYSDYYGSAFIYFKPIKPIKKGSTFPSCVFNLNYAHNRNPIYPIKLSFSIIGGMVSADIPEKWYIDKTAMSFGYQSKMPWE